MEVKSFLDEGYDFIEESCSSIPLEYTEVTEIQESSIPTEHHYKILGTCRGNFQPINVPSRNRRIYESDHWAVQLAKPEVQNRLLSRGMWGTLGHFDRKISDEDIREGRVSHIITKLEIQEDKQGNPFLYGELEILDTPAGRILEAMYKGGASLFVSSRGAGKLIPIIGEEMKKVDKNSFYFEGFDIVRAPGFLAAKPVYEGVTESKETIKESHAETTTLTPVQENSEVAELKGQIDKLAKIIEKVVDDVYEVEESETPVEEAKEKTADDYEFETVRKNALANPNLYGGRYTQKSKAEARKEYDEDKKNRISEAMDDFLKLLSETNITDEVVSDIFDIIFNKKEEK